MYNVNAFTVKKLLVPLVVRQIDPISRTTICEFAKVPNCIARTKQGIVKLLCVCIT